MAIFLQDGQTVLHISASAGNIDTVEALLDRGCDANVQDFVSIVLLPSVGRRHLKVEDDLQKVLEISLTYYIPRGLV